jgi:tRNA G18 (ribose-2'-O)-methylase SpoU
MASALILHNIRSVHNVGSIFRTADAAGVSRIILSGYTPLPNDKYGLPRKDFAKVSLGAEKTIPWQQTKTFSSAVKMLKKEDSFIVAVEQDKKSVSIFNFKPPFDKTQGRPKDIALVLGNEVRGLSKSALKLCDAIVEIPMHGKKESLNVSVAAGIAMFIAF